MAKRKNRNSDNNFLVEESFVSQEEAADSENAFDVSPAPADEAAPAGEPGGEAVAVAAGSEGPPADRPAPEKDTSAIAAQPEANKIPVREEVKDEPWLIDLSPADVDFYPPLVQCLAMMAKRGGRSVSANVIAAGLPSGAAASRPSVILRAAKSDLAQISKMTMPCILILQNNGACILTALDDESATVIFTEQGTAERKVARGTLEKEYIGYAVFVKLAAELDARASKIKLVEHSRWFWGTLAGFLPIYKHVFGASLIVNLLTLAAPLFFMNVYDRVVPNGVNALETLWTLGTVSYTH